MGFSFDTVTVCVKEASETESFHDCKCYTYIQKVDPFDKNNYRLESINDCNGTRTHNHLVRTKTLNHLAKLAQWFELPCEYLSLQCIWLYVLIMSRMRFRVTLYSCLNVKELLAWSRRDIWNSSDWNGTRMQRTDKYSQHNSIIWLVWLNGWVLVYELSRCEFQSLCCHLNFRYHACFEQGVPRHSENYSVRIHSEMRTWHDKNIQTSEYITTFIKSLWKSDVRANVELFWTFFQ